MTTYEEVLGKLIERLQTMAPAHTRVDEHTHLVRTLGLDSTAVIDILLDVEDEFDVVVPLNALADVETVGGLAALVHRLGSEAR